MNSGVFPLKLQKKIGNKNIADTNMFDGSEIYIQPLK